MQKKYPISEKDTILQKTPFVFDVSVWELFWWGITGARVSMLEAGYEKFPQAIIKEIQQCDITTMHFVPSMMNVFLNYIENSEDAQKMKALKQVFCSGEALLPAHANKFNKLIGLKNSIDLINLYGPTEATVDVTSYDCPKHTEINVIPIGKPIDNIKLYVLKDGELQPPGSEGELCIAGDGLARGYLHKADLTAEKFVENHDVLGQRVYKTGDYVRMSSDQNIEYIGRVDNQIKIRGLRIELGEIESKVSEYETVEQCVVVVKNYGSLNPTFAAYMLSKDEVDVKGIKEFLKTQLPSYMIPNKYITLTEFPLTGNGKIDRKALTEN